jgi:hypothetical protein
VTFVVAGVFGVPDVFWWMKLCGDWSTQGVSDFIGDYLVYSL